MAILADYFSVRARFARSANLERDANQSEPLDGYIVTARALDVVERITATAVAGPSGGAWSLIGPYGSGKSSLALLLDAALGPATPTREAAWKLIDEASPTVGELIRQAHQRHQTQNHGFHRGLVTANREPLSHTVLRTLHAAVLRSYGKIPPASRFEAAKTLRGALEDAATDSPRRTGPSPAAIVEVARCLAEDAPLLLVIDEFGKNLEAIQDGSDADPYLLQQIAEAGQGSGLPIFTLTLQHLSFEDYLAGTDGPQHREWAKVQGRFEDISYVESAKQTRSLIATVFEVGNGRLRDRIARWAQGYAKKMRSLGMDLADPDAIAACYPLHPLAAVVLPELCNRYGQHERTLFSFLTSADPASAASFLTATKLPGRGSLPSLGLEAIFDYFGDRGARAALSASQSSRWTEITTRIRDIHGLSKRQARLVKSIAVLNLVATTGTVRASRQILALIDPEVEDTLVDLVRAGVVTYRDFADEYRVWQGTDIDIRGLLDAAHQRVQRQPLLEVLTALDQPPATVAARHSAEHDVLRVFSRRYADPEQPIEPLDPFSPYDGEVLLLIGSDQAVPSLAQSTAPAKPVVAAIPTDLTDLDRAAREVAVVTSVLDDPPVQTDWVARRELRERLAETRVTLERAVTATFTSDACRWILLSPAANVPLPAGRGSAALSVAADLVYASTPTIRNEMLNRTSPTTQGSKARRLLLQAMIEDGDSPGLALDGYGPEVAMYRAFLERTGIHSRDARNDTMSFRKPTDPSLQPAWQVLVAEFRRARTRRINLRDLYAALLSPPVGMKAAVAPVFVTAGLLAFRDKVAIYEHGTFKPLLTSDLSERMVRNPGHFDVKHFANTSGARRQVIQAIGDRLGVRPGFRRHRVANVLAIVGHLVSRMRTLDNYTLRTHNLTPTTLKARDTLLPAVEPDELLFDSLPKVLGFRPIPPHTKTYSNALPFANKIRVVLDELARSYDHLLTGLFDSLLEVSAETSRLALTGQAASLQDEVLNPTVRAFVLTLANDAVDTDTDWIEAVATVVSKRAPAEWTDDDLLRFHHELPQQIAAFQRLVALHAAHRADSAAPFSALRVTITRPDGEEHVGLVDIESRERQPARQALDAAIEQLTQITGSSHRAHRALLALLGDRFLSQRTDSDDKVGVNPIQGRFKHG